MNTKAKKHALGLVDITIAFFLLILLSLHEFDRTRLPKMFNGKTFIVLLFIFGIAFFSSLIYLTNMEADSTFRLIHLMP